MTPYREEPLVSIITPAYNAEAFLGETIASVRAQTYAQWEWIIADDASTDRTAAIAAEAARVDPRIRVLAVEGRNGSAARARNTAMAAARGHLFALLDADDLWLPEKLARQVQYLAEHPEAHGVCTWYALFGDEAAVRYRSKMLRMDPSPVVLRREMIASCPFLTSTVMFRRCCYDELGGMDEDPRLRSGQDYEYFARLLNRFALHRIPEVLVHYRAGAAQPSLSARHLHEQNERGWRIFEVLCEKGILTPQEQRAKRAALYYEQAKDNLFHLHGPFRGALCRSAATGCPPREAAIMLALSFLPAPVLRRVLLGVRGWINRRRVIGSSRA